MVTLLLFEGGISPEQVKKLAKLFDAEDLYQDEEKCTQKAAELTKMGQFSYSCLEKSIKSGAQDS